MGSTDLLRSRDMPTTLGFAAVGVIAATCLGIAAASDTISAVNPFYFNHTPDRGNGANLDASTGPDPIPTTQLAVDNGAPVPLYAEARSPYQLRVQLAPSYPSSGFDRDTASARIGGETVDEEQRVELEHVPASAVSEAAPAADETGQPLERGIVAERDADDNSLDPPDSTAVRFSATADANQPP